MDSMHKWRGQFVCAHGTEKSQGVAILFKRFLPVHIKKTYEDPQGRFLVLQVLLGSRSLLLCNVYAPNEDDEMFWVGLISKLGEFPSEEIVC